MEQAFRAFLSGTFLAAGAVGALAPALQKQLLAVFATEHALRIDSAVQIAVPLLTGLAAGVLTVRGAKRSRTA